MNEFRIAAIPGDGIGKEVIPAGIRVLEVLQECEGTFRMQFDTLPWGCDYYHETGRMMAEDGLEVLIDYDAIYFGAVGHPSVPDHISLWGLRLNICQGFDQYANVRPARILPGITSPLRDRDTGDLDWVIIRENSEGEYSGVGGRAHRGLPEEVSMDPGLIPEDQRKTRGIDLLPQNLGEAIAALRNDEVLQNAMGPHLARSYIAVRQNEWDNLKNLSLEEEVALLAERY